MKHTALALGCLLVGTAALAETPRPPPPAPPPAEAPEQARTVAPRQAPRAPAPAPAGDPEKQALAETVMSLTRDTVALRQQIITLMAEVERAKGETKP